MNCSDERNELNDLELSLAAELQQVSPPPGFEDAVMFRIAQEKQATQKKQATHEKQAAKSKFRVLPMRHPWSWLALSAALLLVLLPATYALRGLRERRQAALTRTRFDLAMRLTSRTLTHVDQTINGTLNRAGARTEDHSNASFQESQP